MLSKLILAGLTLLLVLTGSAFEAQAQKNNVAKGQHKPRVIVMGMDATGSYAIWEQAKAIAIRVIYHLQPGDILYLRKITDKSYSHSCHVLRLELPGRDAPDHHNPFDRRAKRERKAAIVENLSRKKAAIEMVKALRSANAPHTDILGFLAVATEKFEVTGQGFDKFVVMATDLQDNVNYQPELNLAGAHTAVLGFQPMADPAATRKFKTQWSEYLKKAGASRTTFLRAEEPFNLNDL